MTREEILDLPVRRHDLGATLSMRQFFERLFIKLWDEAENFSGKRPYGNSDWKWDVYVTLIQNGVIEGKLDENGYVEEIDEEKASQFVADEILYPFFIS
jgi:hypothetical protein